MDAQEYRVPQYAIEDAEYDCIYKEINLPSFSAATQAKK